MGAALLRLWNIIETALISAMAATALLLGIYQIGSRYLAPELSYAGTEEMTVYLLVWAMFLSCSQIVARDAHVRPDLVLRLMPARGQRFLEMMNCVVAIVFCSGMAWYGARVVMEAYAYDDRSTGVLSFPMWIYDLALPIAGILMTLRYAIRLAAIGGRSDAQGQAPWTAVRE
jgi:TRAP-type C4-dicarboxylate transport system permease small subunit